jgi:molybdopterin-guanine dinucleotide biosynthesis protein A
MAGSETSSSALTVGAVVLAGGRARRFGGQDKGLILLDGRPLVAWVIQRLRPQVAELVLSANRNLTAYAALGRVVADVLPGQPGPLAGLHAASGHLACEWVLTAPCDTPFLPLDLLDRLLAGASQAGVEAVYAADARQAHYTVMLVRRPLLADIAVFLDEGGRRVQDWLARVHARPVVFGDAAQAFFNVNTPEDLVRAEASLPGARVRE